METPVMNLIPRRMHYQLPYNPNGDPNWDQQMYYNDQSPPKVDRNANLSSYINASLEPPNEKPAEPVLNVPPTTLAPVTVPSEAPKSADDTVKSTQLQKMVQELYLAQGQVQLEATEIKRAQTIASSAQQNLEDSANNVRVITAALRAAQESVANAALRAQTAQLQLAAHDQLLFTARQKVDALSAQMVGLQAEVGITAGARPSVDLAALLNRLKQPLQPEDQPKPISSVAELSSVDDLPHPLTIHSTDKNAWPQQQPPFDAKHSADVVERSRRSGLNMDDVEDMLRWVRNEKNAELSKAMSGNTDAFNTKREEDYSKRFVRDFVANMQNLNSHHHNGYDGVSEKELSESNPRHRRNEASTATQRQRKRRHFDE